MRWLALMAALVPATAGAESLVATRTIRAQTMLMPQDVAIVADDLPGALFDPQDAVGLEARVVLYAGRAIRPEDLGPPAIIERNQIVPLSFTTGVLAIQAEGRALARGGVGDTIRVMNLASRTTVTGRVAHDGTVQVGASN